MHRLYEDVLALYPPGPKRDMGIERLHRNGGLQPLPALAAEDASGPNYNSMPPR